jgi:DNA-binding MarR family transcriptional regulator
MHRPRLGAGPLRQAPPAPLPPTSRPNLTLGDLAVELGLTTAAITRLTDLAEALGYARRIRSKQDRRIIRIRITPQGDEAIADIIAAGTAAAWQNLTPA